MSQEREHVRGYKPFGLEALLMGGHKSVRTLVAQEGKRYARLDRSSRCVARGLIWGHC